MDTAQGRGETDVGSSLSGRPIVLTGGIGSGNSSVGRLLAGWGAFLVDADQLARDLTNLPAGHLSPEQFAGFARDLKQHGVKVTVLDERLGFNVRLHRRSWCIWPVGEETSSNKHEGLPL